MYRVLIADDEYEIRTSLARYLPWDQSGFVVAAQAANGLEAKYWVEKNETDVVFCDIQMPRMNGLEFARWAWETNQPFVVVFLSAYRKFEFAQEALRYGVRRYLVKPPNMEDFASTLRSIKDELDQRASHSSIPTPAKDPVTEIVKSYIHGDPGNATIEGAARLITMSSHYLSTYFKEKTGETFSDCLLRTKMERAAFLLKEGFRSISDISWEVGYSNPKNFSRAFSSYFGCSPRDFKLHRSRGPESET